MFKEDQEVPSFSLGYDDFRTDLFQYEFSSEMDPEKSSQVTLADMESVENMTDESFFVTDAVKYEPFVDKTGWDATDNARVDVSGFVQSLPAPISQNPEMEVAQSHPVQLNKLSIDHEVLVKEPIRSINRLLRTRGVTKVEERELKKLRRREKNKESQQRSRRRRDDRLSQIELDNHKYLEQLDFLLKENAQLREANMELSRRLENR